jgi:hypothetical protein
MSPFRYRLATAVAAATAAATAAAAAPSAPVVVTLVSDAPISTTEPTFASWNIDPSCNRGFRDTAFDNANLLAAAVALRPSRLRFGGSGADALVYGLSDGAPECAAAGVNESACFTGYTTPGCLNASHWDALFSLAQNSDTDFIFGVSINLAEACAAGPGYVWNASNAATLLAYLRRSGQAVWGFELGNEANNNGGAPCNLTPAMQAGAFNAFARMVAEALPGAKLIGPDTGYASWQTWLSALLPLVRPGLLHAVTHHVYLGMERKDFNVPDLFDTPVPEIEWYTSACRSLAPTAQIWAGENGPIGGGNDGTCGAESVCGTFASTLFYADDMALRAKHGFSQYNRQDLFGGAYGLTASPSGAMALARDDVVAVRPDFWTSFLWKRTLGLSVLNATSSSRLVRAYAFAGAPPSPFASGLCGGGGGGSGGSGLQLLLLNLDNATSAAVTLPPAGAGASVTFAAWSLTPTASGGPFARVAALNGAVLPAAIDVARGDPRSFLERIVQPPVTGLVSGGAELPPLSTTFLCYSA